MAVPASEAIKKKWPSTNEFVDVVFYVSFLVLTPFLLLLIFWAKWAAARFQPKFPPRAAWPWWKAIAATIAFAIWALAVPGNPFLKDTTLTWVAWLGALLLSIVLGLVDQIVSRID